MEDTSKTATEVVNEKEIRQKELEEVVKKIVSKVKELDLPETAEDDDKFKQCAADIVSILIKEKIVLSEAAFISARASGIFQRIFAAVTQTIDEGCNDKLAEMAGVEHAGKIPVEKVVK